MPDNEPPKRKHSLISERGTFDTRWTLLILFDIISFPGDLLAGVSSELKSLVEGQIH